MMFEVKENPAKLKYVGTSTTDVDHIYKLSIQSVKNFQK